MINLNDNNHQSCILLRRLFMVILSINFLIISTTVFASNGSNSISIDVVHAISSHPITIHFTARVDQIDSTTIAYYNNAIHKDDIITGSLTYDLATPDKIPLDLRNGIYEYVTSPSIFRIAMNDNGISFGTVPNNPHASITVVNLDPIIGNGPVLDNSHTDHIAVVAVSPTGNIINNIPIHGKPVQEIIMDFQNRRGNATSSDALPAYSPDLNVWPNHYIAIDGPKGTNAFIGANITSIS